MMSCFCTNRAEAGFFRPALADLAVAVVAGFAAGLGLLADIFFVVALSTFFIAALSLAVACLPCVISSIDRPVLMEKSASLRMSGCFAVRAASSSDLISS